jgi:hypothetical protein
MNPTHLIAALLTAAFLCTTGHAQMHPGSVGAILNADADADAGIGFDPEPGLSPMTLEALERSRLRRAHHFDVESDVQRRVREAKEEANRRWLERRVERDIPFDSGAYLLEAGWVDADGTPVPEAWPWWLW